MKKEIRTKLKWATTQQTNKLTCVPSQDLDQPGNLWGAVLLFIPYLWISKIHFCILKYIFGYLKISWLLDIHNSIFGYPKLNYGYPKIHSDFWISINLFLDIQKSVEYWISIILIMDIQKLIMDILNTPQFFDTNKSIFGYPKISWILDIHNLIFGYPKIELWIS